MTTDDIVNALYYGDCWEVATSQVEPKGEKE